MAKAVAFLAAEESSLRHRYELFVDGRQARIRGPIPIGGLQGKTALVTDGTPRYRLPIIQATHPPSPQVRFQLIRCTGPGGWSATRRMRAAGVDEDYTREARSRQLDGKRASVPDGDQPD